jgi:hypothetical protein
MYLKQLLHHNKFWFAMIVLFIIGQLFINFKRGMVFSPFFHYGMYSAMMKPKNNYPVFEVIVDEEVLQAKDFTPQQWDKIQQPLIYFKEHKEWNSDQFSEANRLFGLSDTSKFMNNLPKRSFYTWYQNYLSLVLEKKVMTLLVQQKNYSPAR